MTSELSQNLPQVLLEYEFLVWDFDGTLVHLNVDWTSLKKDLAALVSCPAAETLQAIIVRAKDQQQFDAVARLIAQVEIAHMNAWPLRVALLRRHLDRSCIVTNNFATTVRYFFSQSSLSPIPFVSRDMVTAPKPSAEGILKLAQLWQSKRTLLIGDSDSDRELAATVQIDFFHVVANGSV